MAGNLEELKVAVEAALNDEWDRSHNIVQEYGDSYACWIHAVLHKIEGDAWNSRYWYARTQHQYEEYPDPCAELQAIAELLDSE
jgi:hypothetical protein